jgi:hypothetical protein
MSSHDDMVLGEINTAEGQTSINAVANLEYTVYLSNATGGGLLVQANGAQVKADGPAPPGVSATSSNGPGMIGNATNAAGVIGRSKTKPGVWGKSKTAAGVQGESEQGYGVFGSTDAFGAGPAGVFGAGNGKAAGVRGEAPTTGVFGFVTGNQGGIGVYGKALNGKGVHGDTLTGAGVHGSSAQSGTGVSGESIKGTGVNGKSKEVSGVRGESENGAALFGYSKNGTGLHAESSNGLAAVLASGWKTALYVQTVLGGNAAEFHGNVTISGNLDVTGAKNAVVPFPDGSHRRVYCQESPEPWFEDFNEAKLAKGKAEVMIDRKFAKTVDLAKKYHVFVQAHDIRTRGLVVVKRLPDRFVIEEQDGHGNGTFSYRLVARRKDLPGARFERVKLPRRIAASRLARRRR